MRNRFKLGLANGGRAWLSGVLLSAVVGPAWAALPAPTTVQVKEGGTLDPNDIPANGLNVETMTGGPTYNQQALVLQLLANGTVVVSQRTVVGLSTRPIRLSLDKAHFASHAGSPMQIRYCVGSPALQDAQVCAQLASPPLSFRVVQGFAGSYSHDLTGKGLVAVYRDGEIQLPKEGPEREAFSFVRQAPGGTDYKSSDESVAVVDKTQGRVTALRNGTATITAQVAGQAQAYQLTVLGIHQFDVVASDGSTWNQASTQCMRLGWRLAQAVDFNDLKGRFPAQMRTLGLPNYPAWGAEVNSNIATTFDPRTDEVTSEATDPNLLRQVICFKS
ncbi:Ig-like domain-containing protein [Pseudomonas entomophila]|uniref:Ig-like domain-containing protein n=1 Tax=Pseudomonas entomophila TaxID=312306 RepID=UPI002404B0B6|nr:Ig-like domain-containing protein [Pseudomonas entomophila]MDF9618045.1 Ig-like domain-containing protein [Pseudomonas entomophila]